MTNFFTAEEFIIAILDPNGVFYLPNYRDKIEFIIDCMEDNSQDMKDGIKHIIQSKFPQYISIITNPDKYKLLL